ncbi:MAG: class I SAM-dependent methyltransferase [Bacteroidota bacterium]
MEQQVLCRFCKGSNTSEQYSAVDIFDDKWFVYHCNTCRAFFLAPFPSAMQLKKAYDASYYGAGEHKFIFSVEQFIDFFRRRKARKIASVIPCLAGRQAENAKVLDIGCGNGKFLKHLSALGNYELHGTELEGGSAERASLVKEIKLRIGYLNKDDFPQDYFHAVTLFHVFEHLEEPKKTLEIIHGILKKNGILLMSFPNISGWQAKIFKGRWYHLDPPRHLVFFAPDDLTKIMNDMGFTLIRKKYFSFEQNPYGWVQSSLNSLCRKREFLYERLKGNKKYADEKGFFSYFIHVSFFIFSFPFFAFFNLIESVFSKGATVRMEFKKE